MAAKQIYVFGQWAAGSTGIVLFRLSSPLVDTSTGPATRYGTAFRTATLNAQAQIGITLVATDDQAIQPTGQTWSVIEVINGHREDPYDVVIPAGAPGGTIDLHSLTPTSGPQAPSLYAPPPSSFTNARLNNRTGIYVPSDWGASWRPALAAAHARAGKAVCAILGASIDEQVHYPTSSARSWVGMLKAALQGPAGSPADGGSGFVGVNYAAIYQAPGFASYATEYVNDPMFVAASAGWAVGTAHDGPGVEQLQSNTSGDTITWKNIRGTTITVFFFKFVPAGGNSGGLWTPAIDGTSQAQQTCAGGTPTNGDGAGNPAQVSFASSAGAHIVAVTNNSTGATVYAFIEGVSGENASGVIVNNFAAGSRASGDYVTGSSPILNGGSSYPCDLAIYSLAANDAIGNVTDDTWESNVRVSLDAIRAGKSGQTDLVILMHHIGTADGSSHYWNKYVMRARGIAEAYGAALINPWAMLRNNYAYAQALGYFGNQAAPGAAGTDFIHPGDAGHQFIFNAVAPLLTAAA